MRNRPARFLNTAMLASGFAALLPMSVAADCDGEGCLGTAPVGDPLGAIVLFGLFVLLGLALAASEARRS